MNIPFKCPVCRGNGQVSGSFYTGNGEGYSTNTHTMCRSCSGTGIVWGSEDENSTYTDVKEFPKP